MPKILFCALLLAGQPALTQPREPWRETKTSLYLTFTSAMQRYDVSRQGLTLAREASRTSLSGRPEEAEALAERSVAILRNRYPSNHPILLQPLQILASARLDQRKIGKARDTIRTMRTLALERPEDRALLAGTAGALLQMEDRLDEAESLYRNALAVWRESGNDNSAQAATILSCLGTLYIHAGRYREAQQSLDQALAVLSRARDAVPLDRIKLLNNRGVLYGREGRWAEAEADLRGAISTADTEAHLDPLYLSTMLVNFAQILRKNHHAPEARAMEARAAVLRSAASKTVVDVSEFPAGKKFLW
jgi:tetratricopeptide (TPR) repeat protein